MTINYQFPSSLPPNTIIPENWNLFIPYMTRLYEDIAFTVNTKQNGFYPIAITNTATDIINVPNFGSFIICVSGVTPGLPTLTAALNKANSTNAGVINVLGSQAGNVAPWAAATLTITSTATNFQINHSVSGQSGNFNIKVLGTQV